jgi:anti-sigma factor RsiW
VADPRDPHAEHDPLIVARLLDRDLDGEERAIAETRIASCPSCAALHADLVALSVATGTQPTPARPRAFTLTAADAARLATDPAGEPGSTMPRLTGVMTEPFTSSDHASHDTILVASLADHSLPASERTAAEALVAACSQCADLHADLLALRAATRAMPTPPRPADYTLTPRDAVRLRSGGWRRFVAILGTSRDALSRPLAVGLTTLGLAGLLVATLPSFSMGSAASGPVVDAPAAGAGVDTGDRTTLEASAAAEAAASAAPPAPAAGAITDAAGDPSAAAPAPGVPGFVAGATQEPDTESVTNGSSKGQGGAPGRARVDNPSDLLLAQEIGGVSPLVILSIAFLIAGIGLFVLRWTARRFGD